MNVNARPTALSATMQLPDVAAWSNKAEPMVRIRADDGKTYCAIFQHTAAVYDEEGRSFTIHCGHGHIRIEGPGTGDLVKDFCGGRATMIQMNGAEITSVRVLSADEVTDAAAAAEASRIVGRQPSARALEAE
jgi:hypothetical protein